MGAVVRHIARDDEAAKAEALKALELDRDYAPALFVFCLSALRLGEAKATVEKAERLVSLTDRHAPHVGVLAMAYADAGEPDRALAMLEELELRAANEYVTPLALLMALSSLGRTEEALDMYERVLAERQAILFVPSFAIFRHIESEPRFQAALRRSRQPRGS